MKVRVRKNEKVIKGMECIILFVQNIKFLPSYKLQSIQSKRGLAISRQIFFLTSTIHTHATSHARTALKYVFNEGG